MISNPTDNEEDTGINVAFDMIELKISDKLTQEILQFNPPIVLRNLLPCSLSYVAQNDTESIYINPGSSVDIYKVKTFENIKFKA